MGYKRRKHNNRKASVKQVEAIVRKEVGKTREQQRMVSYVSWSRMQDIMVAAGATGADEVCVYSLTGGLNPLIDTTQDPQTYVAKQLFTLLPSETGGAALLAGVGQAGDGGTANIMDGVGGQSNISVQNVHQLEGRQCHLNKFYCRVGLNNATTSVTIPTNMFIRVLVIETYRPLSSKALSQQILLQSHAVPAKNATVLPLNYPVSALGYLNRNVIKKVYHDRLINLNGGSGATGSMRSFKLKINLNKKCKWDYLYSTRDPVSLGQTLTYQGPFLYMLMWPSASGVYGAAWGEIGADRLPAFAINSLLTFYDD